jgi:hypothetical protein
MLCRAIACDADGIDVNVSLKDVHKFVDEYEVELVARCCRCACASCHVEQQGRLRAA